MLKTAPGHPVALALAATAVLSVTLLTVAVHAAGQESAEISARVSLKQEELAAVNQELDLVKQLITEQEIRLELTRAELAEASAQLLEAETRHEQSVTVLSERVAAIYKTGGFVDIYAIVLSSVDFADAINRLSFLIRISESDAGLIERVEAEENELRALRDRVEQLKQEQADELESLQTQQVSLQQQVAADQQQVDVELDKLSQAKQGEREEEARKAEQLKSDAGPPMGSIAPPLLSGSGSPEGLQPSGVVLDGIASWYGPRFGGQHTANGEVYNMNAITAAHRTLPFGTWLKVTYDGRSVFVRINDRGPYIPGRFLDLSLGSAQAIGLTGIGYVTAEIYR